MSNMDIDRERPGLDLSFLGDADLSSSQGPVSMSSFITSDTLVFGVYFSGKWCAPCRAFTPILARLYTTLPGLKIVFISADHDEEGYLNYSNAMPWPSVAFSDSDRRRAAFDHFRIRSVPTLILINAQTGELLSRDGRAIVTGDPFGRNFPWTDQKDPEYCLDRLMHTDPMPGPVWRDRVFMGAFLDPFLDSVEMEGGHLARAGDLGALMQVVSDVTNVEIPGWNEAIELAKAVASVQKEPQMVQLISAFMERIRGVPVGGMLIVPGGWRGVGGAGRVVMATILRKTDTTFGFYLHNTGGKGIEYHDSSPNSPPKMKYKSTLRLESVDRSKLVDEGWWYVWWKMYAAESDDHRMEILYEVLLPDLCDGASVAAKALEDKGEEFQTPQRSKACYTRVVLETLRFHLREGGMNPGEVKHVMFQMHTKLLEYAVKDLGEVKEILESDHTLLGTACKQLARSSVKELEAGRISQLDETHSLICSVKELADSRVTGYESVPILDMTLVAPWRPLDTFGHIPRLLDIEHFAGWKNQTTSKPVIDFSTIRDFATSFTEAIEMMKTCRTLCNDLQNSRASSGSAYFSCCSVIQKLFCEILPSPSIDPDTCIWATADMEYEVQVEVLTLVQDLAQVYIVAARSLKHDAHFQTAQVIVMASILAIADAVVRVHAADVPSMLTYLLNGTEYLRDVIVQHGFVPDDLDVKSKPVYFLSLKTGGGVDFTDLTAHSATLDPVLAVARGKILDYFGDQEEKSSKALFSFATRMNSSTYLGKNGPTLEFVKAMCLLCGYDLNPDDEEGGMDDGVSFIEAATWYLIDGQSPLITERPEFQIYRDLAMMYKIISADPGHRRSIKLRRWFKDDAKLSWMVKEVNSAKTMIDIDVAGFDESALCVDRKPVVSIADTARYIDDVKVATEDDVLHCKSLPTFGDNLTEQDSEYLLSLCTVPYMRMAMVFDFFATKDRISSILDSDIQELLLAIAFEPGRFTSLIRNHHQIHNIPEDRVDLIGCDSGLLINEIVHSPSLLLESLLRLGEFALELNTGFYTSTSSEIILFVTRLLARINLYFKYCFANFDFIIYQLVDESATDFDISQVESCYLRLRAFLVDRVCSILTLWEADARDASDLDTCCMLRAHMVMIFGGYRPQDFGKDQIAEFLSHFAFLQTWYSAGVGQGQAFEEEKPNPFGRSLRGFKFAPKVEEKTEQEPEVDLKVSDHELFDLMQLVRTHILEWFFRASGPDVNYVLDRVLRTATRTPDIQSLGWQPKSVDRLGMFSTANGDIDMDIQTAELFFRSAHIRPVAHYMARMEDYAQVFGKEPQHCALVAKHDNREWVRLVGKDCNLKYWQIPQPDICVVNQPMEIPIDPAKHTSWMCFVCGTEYPLDEEGCTDCQKPRPQIMGFNDGDCEYSRVYHQTNLTEDENWVFEVLEPALLATFQKREKVPYYLYICSESITDDSCRVIARERYTFREFWVYKDKRFIEAFVLLEHGRRMFRSLVYTSNMRLSLASLEANTDNRALPWDDSVRFAAGDIQAPTKPRPSLVISRDREDKEEVFIPERLLRGLVPSVLLENFRFWQTSSLDGEETLSGYPIDTNIPQWHYKVHVQLVTLASGDVTATVSRLKLTEDDLNEERRRGNFLKVSKQLSVDEALVEAMNKSKLDLLEDQGYPREMAQGVLDSFDYDLPLTQAWLMDPANSDAIQNLISNAEAMEEDSPTSSDHAVDAIKRHSQGVLLNLRNAEKDSPLWRLAEVLTRVENLSHILVWTSSEPEEIEQESRISLIELPRLKLKLQPRQDEDGIVRLYSLDHAGEFISDFRDEYLEELVRGIPHSLVLENSQHELSVLVPNYPVHRPIIARCPFSTELVMNRGETEWLDHMADTRFFLYPVHCSHTFMTTPTQGAALHLILLRMLSRNYGEAFRVVQSCEADTELSVEEKWLFSQLDKADADKHPDAHACRLKLSLVMMHSNESFPWFLQEEYRQYLAKLSLVSCECRLSYHEEVYLLQFVQSGAEFEALTEDEKKANLQPAAMEIELSNRLAWLLAESEEGEMKSNTVVLQKQFQRGRKTKFHQVELAAAKFYGNFTEDSRTWSATIQYSKPDSDARSFASGAIKTLSGLWKDNITGQARRLGLFFLADLLTDSVRIRISNESSSCSPSLGRLFTRILYLKNIGWGAMPDLDLHRSYRERSMVPYIILSLLESWALCKTDVPPQLEYGQNQFELSEGCSTSNRDDTVTAAARFIDTVLVQGEEIVFSPIREGRLAMNEFLGELTPSDLNEVPFRSETLDLTLPLVGDFDCFERTIESFDYSPVIHMSPEELSIHLTRPLSCINLDDFVELGVSGNQVDESLPFDLSEHVEAQSHVAKRLLNRLGTDLKLHSKMCSEMQVAELIGLRSGSVDQSSIDGGVTMLSELAGRLQRLRTSDMAQIGPSIELLTSLANEVGENSSELLQFHMDRECGHASWISLDYITASLLSVNPSFELLKLNPFLEPESIETILNVTWGLVLRLNRVGIIDRCLSMTRELKAQLHQLSRLNSNESEFARIRGQTGFKCLDLASALSVERFSCAGKSTIDPRYLVFEYLFNIVLRNKQVTLLDTFKNAHEMDQSMVEQMIMGAGKTTVVGPLLSLICANGDQLVTMVVPTPLLEFSRGILRSHFTRVISKRIHTFTFDRTVKKVSTIKRLFDKLDMARKTKGVVVTTPDAIKSLQLKYLELLHQIEEAPGILSESAEDRLKVRSDMADALSSVLGLWKNGLLLMDEVDLLLHPLRSELNFPIGRKQSLELSPDRWELPVHILDAIFVAELGEMSVNFKESAAAASILRSVCEVIDAGIVAKNLQTSPHIVLMNVSWYHSSLKPCLAPWVLLWLRSKQFALADVPDGDYIEFLTFGDQASGDVLSRLRDAGHSAIQSQIMTLAFDWLHSYTPHMLSKINRVSFGLLRKQDMKHVDPNMPQSRKLLAVPFLGKDVPSHASEFAHPDVLIGLTVLAYRYEGLRMSDLHSVVALLQKEMRNEVEPKPSVVMFQEWIEKGERFKGLLEKCMLKRGVSETIEGEETKTMEGVIMPLPVFQLSDQSQMIRLMDRVGQLPDIVHYYLEQVVFPACLQHQKMKLSASGQELGGSMLFKTRFGFSGTPSDLLPVELGDCGYERGSEGKIANCLTDSDIVDYVTPDDADWNPKGLLGWVADSKAHALIDTGALVTGMSNLEVAEFLLEHGLPSMEGVVFLDRLDRQMILLRASGKVSLLSQCGIPKEKRFTFYDQVHTTGMDIKQALDAKAIVTLGKDMTWRDYAQGCYRMRGIGKGQTITLYVIPEIRRLMEREVGQNSVVVDVCAWLLVNSMRSEKLQFMQLCVQSLTNVWRKKAFAELWKETDGATDEDTRRYHRFQEISNSGIEWLKKCIAVFRETIDFSVSTEIGNADTFQDTLAKLAATNSIFYNEDKGAGSNVKQILSIASTSNESQVEEAFRKNLNSEMVQEAEQEAEKQKEKQVEQEQQVRVRFSREDEDQVPWPIHQLASFGQEHSFYTFSKFSIRGTNMSDLLLPEHLLVSSNYFRPEWAAMGQRRLKNISLILEWIPQKQEHMDIDAAELTLEQQVSLEHAFKLLDLDEDGLVNSHELQRAFETMGESTLNCDNQVDVAAFMSLLRQRSSIGESEHRYFVAISLSEAETLRRVIHTGHPILRNQAAFVGLRTLEGKLLDCSRGFKNGSEEFRSMSLESFRFLNCEFFYSELEQSLLLRSLSRNSAVVRRAAFENLLLCRRRDRRRWNDTPLARMFHLKDEFALLELRSKIWRISVEIRRKGMMLGDAFIAFDIVGDGVISATELKYAVQWLGLSMEVADVVEFGDRDDDGTLDLDEFTSIFEVPGRAALGAFTPNVVGRLSMPESGWEEWRHEKDLRREREEKEEAERKALELEREEEERIERELEKEKAQVWRAQEEERRLQRLLVPDEFWSCPVCTVQNESNRRKCSVCDSARPEEKKAEAIDDDEEVSFWQCGSCTFLNGKTNVQCELCFAARPAESQAKREKIVEIWECPGCTKLNGVSAKHCPICDTKQPVIME